MPPSIGVTTAWRSGQMAASAGSSLGSCDIAGNVAPTSLEEPIGPVGLFSGEQIA